MVSTDHFRQAIRSRFELASAQGRQDLTIECGELYWSVSKLPVFDPWMIFCCNAMRAEMAMTDRLVFDYSKASLLTIHYKFPRHQTSPPKSNHVLLPPSLVELRRTSRFARNRKISFHGATNQPDGQITK